jgi:Rieske Fe-S protein
MILVLGPDSSAQAISEITGAAERLGWRCDVSRGEEQVVIGLEGNGDAAGLEAALAQRGDVELVPILSRREYLRVRQRRQIMRGLATGMGVLAAIAAGEPVLGFLLPPKGTLSDRSVVRAAKKGELGERSSRQVTVLGKPVLLVHLEGGRYFALSAICTHMDICHLEWNAERCQLLCPCHGGAFDVFGNVVQGPPSIPLSSYAVEERGDELFIHRQA